MHQYLCLSLSNPLPPLSLSLTTPHLVSVYLPHSLSSFLSSPVCLSCSLSVPFSTELVKAVGHPPRARICSKFATCYKAVFPCTVTKCLVILEYCVTVNNKVWSKLTLYVKCHETTLSWINLIWPDMTWFDKQNWNITLQNTDERFSLLTHWQKRDTKGSWPVPTSASWITKRLARTASVYEVTFL